MIPCCWIRNIDVQYVLYGSMSLSVIFLGGISLLFDVNTIFTVIPCLQYYSIYVIQQRTSCSLFYILLDAILLQVAVSKRHITLNAGNVNLAWHGMWPVHLHSFYSYHCSRNPKNMTNAGLLQS